MLTITDNQTGKVYEVPKDLESLMGNFGVTWDVSYCDRFTATDSESVPRTKVEEFLEDVEIYSQKIGHSPSPSADYGYAQMGISLDKIGRLALKHFGIGGKG